MLGAGHSHSGRVVELLRTAQAATADTDFVRFDGPIGLDVVIRAPVGMDPWDATNYLGGIGDVLEDKSRRTQVSLAHLGDLVTVALYRNDRQIREVHYRSERRGRDALHHQDLSAGINHAVDLRLRHFRQQTPADRSVARWMEVRSHRSRVWKATHTAPASSAVSCRTSSSGIPTVMMVAAPAIPGRSRRSQQRASEGCCDPVQHPRTCPDQP